MPARRELTHGQFGGLPGRPYIAERSRASTLAGLVFAAARWAAVGLLLVASFWAYLGAAELAGGAMPSMSPPQDTHGLQDQGCTVLNLDRPSGRTIAAPCVGPALILRETLAVRLPEPAAR